MSWTRGRCEPAPVIRPATPNDAPGCAAILNAWIDETPWMPRVHSHEDVERHYREFVFQNRKVSVAGRRIAGRLPRFGCGGRVHLILLPEGRSARQWRGKRLLDAAKSEADTCSYGLSSRTQARSGSMSAKVSAKRTAATATMEEGCRIFFTVAGMRKLLSTLAVFSLLGCTKRSPEY